MILSKLKLKPFNFDLDLDVHGKAWVRICVPTRNFLQHSVLPATQIYTNKFTQTSLHKHTNIYVLIVIFSIWFCPNSKKCHFFFKTTIILSSLNESEAHVQYHPHETHCVPRIPWLTPNWSGILRHAELKTSSFWKPGIMFLQYFYYNLYPNVFKVLFDW